MDVTHHPFQAIGAWAAAAMRGRAHPGDLTEDDLNALVERIVQDAVTAAGSPGAWAKALVVAYPNSPPVHPLRGKWSDGELRRRAEDLFGPDQPVLDRCWLCGQSAGQRWGKSLWPLADSPKHVNNQPAGGHAICRSCRIAGWCLPYGSRFGGGKFYTLVSFDDDLNRALAAAHVDFNRQVLDEGWQSWPPRTALEAAYPRILARPTQVEILRWSNENRGSSMDSWIVTDSSARALAALEADPEAARGLEVISQHAGRHPLTLASASHRGQPAPPEAALTRAAAEYLHGLEGDEACFSPEAQAVTEAVAMWTRAHAGSS